LLDVRPFDEICLAALNRLQFHLNLSHMQKSEAHFLLELDQNVNVIVGLRIIPENRAEQCECQDTPAFAKRGDSIGWNGGVCCHACTT